MNNDLDFPKDSTEERDRFVSISKSVRCYMMFKILTYKSNKIINYSNIRSANSPLDKNICLDPLIFPRIVKSKSNLSDNDIATSKSHFKIKT